MSFWTRRRTRSSLMIAAAVLAAGVLTGGALALPQDAEPPAQEPGGDQVAGEQALAEARAHEDAGRWQRAADAYERALHLMPGNEEAQLGLARVRAHLNEAGTIGAVAQELEVQRQRAEAEFDEAKRRATQLLGEKNYRDAEREILLGRIKLDQRREVLPPARYTELRRQADELLAQIDTERELWEQTERQRATEETEREQQQQQVQVAMQRREMIRENLRRVAQLQNELKYDEALQVVNEILFLEPHNPPALALHGMLESIIAYRRYTEIQQIKERRMPLLDLENQWAVIPPAQNISGPGPRSLSGILQYPEDWPNLSFRRISDSGFLLSAADQAILNRIAMNMENVDFAGHTLADVIDYWREVTDVNVIVDWQALALIGVTPSDPVTLRLKDVPAKAVLRHVFEQVGHDLDRPQMEVRDGVLAISTREAIRQRTATLVYDIRDLLFEVQYFDDAPELSLSSDYERDEPEGRHGAVGGRPDPFAGQSANIFGEPEEPENRHTRQERVTDLIAAIQNNIYPESWRDLGGESGSIQELNGNLIITNTPRALQQVEGLLAQLREIQSIQINVEGRFLEVSNDWFEQIGVDLDLYFNTNNTVRQQQLAADPLGHLSDFFGPDGQLLDPIIFGGINDTIDADNPPGINVINFGQAFGIPDGAGGITYITGPVGAPIRTTQGFAPIGINQSHSTLAESLANLAEGFAADVAAANPAFSVGIQFLDDVQVDLLIEATQADRRSIVLTAPRLTFFNGQRAWVAVVTSEAYVSSLIPIVGDSSVAFQPIMGLISEGFVLDVEGVISADRRYVTMTVIAELTTNREFETAEIQGAVGAGDFGGGGVGQIASEVSLPQMDAVLVQTTVSVPDKGTILLGGQRLVNEVEVETGVPVLSKIPFINRFFTNRITSKQELTLLVLIRPEIIIQQENEDILFPGLLDTLGGSSPYLR